MVLETLRAQQRTNAQFNSHMAWAWYRTTVTLVKGERYTHKPTMPLNHDGGNTEKTYHSTEFLDVMLHKRV